MTDAGETQSQRVLGLASLALMGVAAAVAPHPVLWVRAAAPAAAVLLAVFGLLRPGPGSALAVLAAAIAVIAATGLVWQATMPLALGVLFLASRARPALGTVREPMGRVPAWATFGCAAVTPVALMGWVFLLQPDLSDITHGLPKVGLTQLVLGGIAFALANAICEEWIWRGVIQSRLTALLPERDAILVQALSFGAAHAHGFPRGVVGVLLAGIWAILLGMLRRKAGGVLASTIAHIVADVTIAAIVIFGLR